MFDNVLSRTYRPQFLHEGRWEWLTEYPISRAEADRLADQRRADGGTVRLVEVLTHVLES